MGKLGSFAGGAARGATAGANIAAQRGQLDLQQKQQQQKQQQQLLEQANKRVEDAVSQSSNIMEQAQKKAALIDDPQGKASLLDSAKQAIDVLQGSVTKINSGIGNDPAVLQSRFATIKEGVGIAGEQELAARGAGLEAGAKALAVAGAEKDVASFQNFQTSKLAEIPISDPDFEKKAADLIQQGFSRTKTPGVEVTGTPGELGLTTKAKGTLEEKLITIDDSIANLEQIEQSFDPEFLTLPSQIEIGSLELLEKAGVDLSEKNRELIERKSTFMQNAIEAINTTIRQITGAQMSEKEAGRIRKQVPDPEKDGPTKFKTKLRNAIKSSKLARARALHMRKFGLEHDFTTEDEPPLSLEKMESILDSRVEEMRGLGMDDAKIRTRLKEEFGI